MALGPHRVERVAAAPQRDRGGLGLHLRREPGCRFRQRTGTALTTRSTGAGMISTDTVALRGSTSRTAPSVTPTVTVSLTF